MATVSQVELTCDVCGSAEDVKTWTFGLDGKAYEIDLCRKDGNALGRVTARYISKARKATAKPSHRQGQRQHGGRPRFRAATSASGEGAKARAAGSKREAKASHLQLQNAEGASTQAGRAVGARQQRGIFVYGILPADIEVAADMPGVGERPGPLRDVRFGGVAALISEVDLSGLLGSPDDLRTHREILDATATEVPVLPLRFGTVLASEQAVAEELLAAHHDEFTTALDQLEGRAEFQVKGCYVEEAVLGEVSNEAVTARREEDTRALMQAMEGLCVASVAREPARDLDAVHVAFLVAVDQEAEVERVIEDLACQWEGRVEVQLLGPMAAYDFAGTAQPES
jgi:hypothetical protein